MTVKFIKFELATILGTWWGIIGCVVGPFYIVKNIFEFMDGIRDTTWPKRVFFIENELSQEDNIKDYVEIGRLIGEIFVKPTVWKGIPTLRGCDAPESVIELEVAFARIAIVRQIIIQRELQPIAEKMLEGDRAVFDRNVRKCG